MRINRRVLAVIGALLFIPPVILAGLLVTSGNLDGSSTALGGGPLVAGELVSAPEPDWSFVRDIDTIELQLLDAPRSRLIWVVEYEGKLYVMSRNMGTRLGRLWKRWPVQAERDGRAIVRVARKRYLRTLVRIRTGAMVEGVTAEFRRKYGAGTTPSRIAAGTTWLFELAPRTSPRSR